MENGWFLIRIQQGSDPAQHALEMLDVRLEIEEGSGVNGIRREALSVISMRHDGQAFATAISDVRSTQVEAINREFDEIRTGLADDGRDFDTYTFANFQRDILAGYKAVRGDGHDWLWSAYRLAGIVYGEFAYNTKYLDLTCDPAYDIDIRPPFIPSMTTLPIIDPDEDLVLVELQWAG